MFLSSLSQLNYFKKNQNPADFLKTMLKAKRLKKHPIKIQRENNFQLRIALPLITNQTEQCHMYFRQFSDFKKLNSHTRSPQEAPGSRVLTRRRRITKQGKLARGDRLQPGSQESGRKTQGPDPGPEPGPGRQEEHHGGKPRAERYVPPFGEACFRSGEAFGNKVMTDT